MCVWNLVECIVAFVPQEIGGGYPPEHGGLATARVTKNDQSAGYAQAFAEGSARFGAIGLIGLIFEEMAGFPMPAGFALLFQSGQYDIVVFITVGRLNRDAQRQVELAQENFLGGHVDVTLGQVTQVNNVPCGKSLFAVAV